MSEPLFIIGLGCAIMAVVFSILGWLAAVVLRRSDLPVQHNLLLVSILLTLFSPVFAGLVYNQGWGGWMWQIAPSTVPTETNLDADPVWVFTKGMEPNSPALLNLSQAPNQKEQPLPDYLITMTWDRFFPGVFALWGIGSAAGLVWLFRDLLRLQKISKFLVETAKWQEPDDNSLENGHPAIIATPRVSVPMVIGIRDPLIALPLEACRNWSPTEKQAVLLHETAHVNRHDPLVALLVRLARILFWWCLPLHCAASRLNRLREQICDDHVIENQGTGLHLARVMVQLAEQCQQPQTIPQGLGMCDGRIEDMEVRVRNLLNPERIAMTRMSKMARWILVAFAMVALPLGIALQIGAQEIKEEPQPGKIYPNPVPRLNPPPLAPPAIAFPENQILAAGNNRNPVLDRMKKIVEACRGYAGAHNGMWPGDLNDLKATLADWKEVTTHPEHKASYAFHYIPPKNPGEHPRSTAVLVCVLKGQPDPFGATAYADGHLELNSPMIEITARLIEAEKPLTSDKELPSVPAKAKQDPNPGEKPVTATPALVSSVTVLSESGLRKALTAAQEEPKTNILAMPRMMVVDNQRGTLEIASYGTADPTAKGNGPEQGPLNTFKLDITPQIKGDLIQLAVLTEVKTSTPQKDGTTRNAGEMKIETTVSLQSGQTALLVGPKEKGKPTQYLFLTATSHKQVPDQGK